MERVPTGIKEFDELIEGGFPKGSIVLLTGVPGSGKTIFCLQVAKNFAERGKKVLYLNIDGETAEGLALQAEMLGMDIKELIKKKRLIIQRVKDLKNFKKEIKNYVKSGVSMIVLDSLSGALPSLYNPKEVEKYLLFQETTVMGVLDPNFALRIIISEIFDFFRELKLDIAFVVTDKVEGQEGLSRDAISEFIADGIIDFETLGIAGAFNRTIKILKLRKTDHHKEPVTFEIGKGGIIITKEEIEKVAKEF
ncbi:MAG: AAA family ATPase [Candidatus Parvarchaeota archaeon]|nr:AAA family ATPase [Candidatus Jingweiarchaeum tengchongense]MCW1298677.1 AAA family ATPase [Candidatus Jingweiarchaeum tengchongense]MCW1300519.1 AAA family ATPase [Candidatus Jingweiarchaeum tengchongense]MCW1304666.1 AAA family ATPase [Candidatus Jingweiarchaeum tengchongense]MCW1305855.1 AAA family ATPase [Candidatus Jingweiarchaeum tengchongense]